MSVATENVIVSVDPSLAVSGSGSVTVGQILAVMKTASDREMADLMAEMFRGNVIFQERCRAAGTLVEEEVTATPVKAAKKAAAVPAAPKKAAKAKKEVAAAAIPEGEEQPVAASYRLEASEIKAELCQARRYATGSADKRWAPVVYREAQCKRKPVEGAELCQLCSDCFEKESQDEKFKKWLGLITEDPESTTHMLGTEWAAKCKWVGTVSASPAPASPAPEAESGEESATATVSAPAPAAPAPAAPAPAKAAPKAPAKAKEAKAPIVAVLPAAAAAAAAEPVTVAGELTLIGGDFYWVADGKVYSYDQIEDTQGEYKGRLTKEETIDESIAEDD